MSAVDVVVDRVAWYAPAGPVRTTKLQRKRAARRWRQECARARRRQQDVGVTACNRFELGRMNADGVTAIYRATGEEFQVEPGDALLFVRRGGSDDSQRRRGGPHFAVRRSFTRREEGFLMCGCENLTIMMRRSG